MAKFRIDSLAELARQMAFTPHETRAAQIAAAEQLLHLIDPAKAYPFDFIVFRITGYRPKHVSPDLLAGIALQHDLGLLVEQVSETLDVHTASFAEPVLCIADVCERFNVTSKTIQRWRRRGLAARRFLFPDNKRRVGFLLSSVERFFAGHADQVLRGMNFNPVEEDERQEIVRRASRLAAQGDCGEQEISRRVARRMNRSPLTILHTIRKHYEEHLGEAMIPSAPLLIGEEQRGHIIRGWQRGLSLQALACRTQCSHRTVYRVILAERVARLNRRKIKFIDDPLYHGDAARQVVDEIAGQEELTSRVLPEESRVPRDLPAYLQELYRTPLLTAGRERALFLKFNFHKFEFVAARRKLEPQFARARDLNRLEAHFRQATETKNQILRANLRLVVSIARKHLRAGLSLMELISDGNLTLMRAVEGFDLHRGHRFSTYATLALMKGFARSVPRMLAARRSGCGDRVLADIPDARLSHPADRFADRDQVGRLLALLNERERSVVLARYGLEGPDDSTHDEAAQRLGLTRQQFRSIEKGAIDKIRSAFAQS